MNVKYQLQMSFAIIPVSKSEFTVAHYTPWAHAYILPP